MLDSLFKDMGPHRIYSTEAANSNAKKAAEHAVTRIEFGEVHTFGVNVMETISKKIQY